MIPLWPPIGSRLRPSRGAPWPSPAVSESPEAVHAGVLGEPERNLARRLPRVSVLTRLEPVREPSLGLWAPSRGPPRPPDTASELLGRARTAGGPRRSQNDVAREPSLMISSGLLWGSLAALKGPSQGSPGLSRRRPGRPRMGLREEPRKGDNEVTREPSRASSFCFLSGELSALFKS